MKGKRIFFFRKGKKEAGKIYLRLSAICAIKTNAKRYLQISACLTRIQPNSKFIIVSPEGEFAGLVPLACSYSNLAPVHAIYNCSDKRLSQHIGHLWKVIQSIPLTWSVSRLL